MARRRRADLPLLPRARRVPPSRPGTEIPRQRI